VSDALNALRNELTMWYVSLDPRTRGFFEAAYVEAPETVVRALGGAALSAGEISEHASLASVLGADAGASATDLVPYIGITGSPVTAPPLLTDGDAFVLRWDDVNYGSASSGHDDEIGIFDVSNSLVFQDRVGVGALDRAAHATVEVAVPGLATGNYTARILHNADGVDVAYAAYATRERGIQTFSDAVLVVETHVAVSAAGVDLAAARTLLRAVAGAAPISQDRLLADALAAYADAFRHGPARLADRVEPIDRAITYLRASDPGAGYPDLPTVGVLLATSDEAAAERATPDEVFNALLDAAREIVSPRPGSPTGDEDDATPEADFVRGQPPPIQPTAAQPATPPSTDASSGEAYTTVLPGETGRD